MLLLNEALQKAKERFSRYCTRFSRVRHEPSGIVSVLLTDKANARLLILRLSNSLIRATKAVDNGTNRTGSISALANALNCMGCYYRAIWMRVRWSYLREHEIESIHTGIEF